MRALIVAPVLLLASMMLGGATPAMAAPASTQAVAATDLSGQSVRAKRARTRIRVTPARRLVRECDFRLVREVSARGSYIVPRQRCWWARR